MAEVAQRLLLMVLNHHGPHIGVNGAHLVF